MRKLICSALMIQCLVLTACGSTVEHRVNSYCDRMTQAEEFRLTANVQADFGKTIEEYTLEYVFDGEQWTVYVVQPHFVSGITARITKDASELEYDGAILTTGDLTGKGIVPISALPLIHEALSIGMIDCVWAENDMVAGTYIYDDDISVSIWFDKQGNPVAAELMECGAVKAKCVLEDAEIKEAGNETTEETDLGGNQPKESGT